RQLPAQDSLTVNLIEKVQRSRVGAGKLARLAQNRRQQNRMIALRGKSDPDLPYLAELTRAVGELTLELIGADLLVEKLIRAFDRVEQRRWGWILGKFEIDAVIAQPLRLFREPDADDRGARIADLRHAPVAGDRSVDKNDAKRSVVTRQLVEALQRAGPNPLPLQRVRVASDGKGRRMDEL